MLNPLRCEVRGLPSARWRSLGSLVRAVDSAVRVVNQGGGCGCSPLSQCYYHVKAAWLGGAVLAERQLLLIGVLPRYEPPRHSNGWRSVAAFLARFNREGESLEDESLEARLRGISIPHRHRW